jgi:hypothetical protein
LTFRSYYYISFYTNGNVLTPNEITLLSNQAFSSLSPQQFAKLSAAGEWRDLEVGQTVQSRGDHATRVTALRSGELEVSRNGQLLGSFGAGDVPNKNSSHKDCRYPDILNILLVTLFKRLLQVHQVVMHHTDKITTDRLVTHWLKNQAVDSHAFQSRHCFFIRLCFPQHPVCFMRSLHIL